LGNDIKILTNLNEFLNENCKIESRYQNSKVHMEIEKLNINPKTEEQKIEDKIEFTNPN